MRKKIPVKIFTVLFMGTLAACNLVDEKREVTNSTGTFAFFTSNQPALDAGYTADGQTHLRDYFTSFQGEFFASPPEGTFHPYEHPAGCQAASQDGVNLSAIRMVDPGGISLSGDTLASSPVSEVDTKNFIFLSATFIGPGRYVMHSSGRQGFLQFDQNFTVPDLGSNLSLSSDTQLKQVIPSPMVDSSAILHIKRSTNLIVEFTPPAGISYVKFSLGDIDHPDNNIVCYGPPATSLTVPTALLQKFDAGAPGAWLTLDFVSTSLVSNVAKVQEAFIRSTMRHRHGRHVFRDATGTANLIDFGHVSFE